MRRVALVIETARGCGRELIRGITQYVNENYDSQWSIVFEPHGAGEQPPHWLKGWQGDGMLVQVRNKRIADMVRRLGVPAVDLRGEYPVAGLPVVAPDFEAVACMAFQLLHNSGFRQFAFCGLVRGEAPRRDRMGDAFLREIRRHGYWYSVLRIGVRSRRGGALEEIKRQVGEWVVDLPKPVAVMVADHPLGLHVLDACRRVDVAVPDEVAVISAGNDDFVCQLSVPAQTSVDLASDRIGYEGAALLDRLLRGETPPEAPILIKPRGVISRGSTDVLATEDREVAAAIRFIRRNACRPITVSDVLNELAVSRPSLEPRLKRVCGKTIHQEIRRCQIERAKQLLSNSDWPIKHIAVQAGFRTTQYLTRVFRQATGTTPADYRRSSRPTNRQT